MMMWLEALLTSLVILVALMLTLQVPPERSALMDFYIYQSLEDRAALLAEGQTLSFQDEPLCYSWQWSDEPWTAHYSSASCKPQFLDPAHPSHSEHWSLRRGVWGPGYLRWLQMGSWRPS